jgi:group I intron endonuclease
MKYGHDNFSVLILEFVESSENIKKNLLDREQYYLYLLKPALNINPIAGSSLGYQHSEETKQLLSRGAAPYPLGLGQALSPPGASLKMGKYLSEETKKLLSQLFSGELNPFWEKTHSEETLNKMRKNVYVYDAISKELIKKYDSSVMIKKDLKMGYDTLKKYLNSDKPFKGKIFSSIPLNRDDK